MKHIPVKYETTLDYEFMQPLFNARKMLTDRVANSNTSYTYHSKAIDELRLELDKLDNLILKLAGKS